MDTVDQCVHPTTSLHSCNTNGGKGGKGVCAERGNTGRKGGKREGEKEGGRVWGEKGKEGWGVWLCCDRGRGNQDFELH